MSHLCFPRDLYFGGGEGVSGTSELTLPLEQGKLGPFCIVGELLLEWAEILFIRGDCGSSQHGESTGARLQSSSHPLPGPRHQQY